MMALKDRCLICFNSNGLEQHENSEKIVQQLQVIFLLRNVLEVPKENLSSYLMTLSPEFWVTTCSKCNKLVGEARSIYDDMLSSLKRFRVVKQKIVRMIKKSSGELELPVYNSKVTKLVITNETRQFVNTHDYGNLINLFLEGDRKANQILHDQEWNALTNAAEVKEEVVSDSNGVEDHDDMTMNFVDKSCMMSNEVVSLGFGRDNKTASGNDDYIAMNDSFEGVSKKTKMTRENKKTATVVKDNNSDETDDDDDAELIDGQYDDEQDDDWNPEISHRTARNNKRTALAEQKREVQNQAVEKNPIFCPLCRIFKFCIENREKFCEHLEICKGNSDDNEEASQPLDQCCPMCNTYKCSLDGKSDFIEHVMVCKGTATESSEITLSERIFKCRVCPMTKYMKLNTFLQHFLFHKKNIYKCSKCHHRHHWNVGLNYHWRVNHKDSVNVPSSERYITDFSVPDVTWWCSVCNETFPDSKTRDFHLQTVHQKEISKAHLCTECSEGFSCSEELKLHQGTSHVSATSSYTCDVCQQHFLTPKLLRLHNRDIHQTGLFVCDVCGTEIRSRSSFKTHLQLHQEVKNYVCDQCSQSFTTSQYLQNHKFRDHIPPDDNINPLACKVCKKVFNNKSYMKKHLMSVHERKYRYTCDKCGNGFLEQCQLKLHLVKKHGIGEPKKYICTVEDCKKEFWVITDFKSHMSRHKNEPQFKCSYCFKEFFCNSHRRRHEKIHTNKLSLYIIVLSNCWS